MVQMAIIDDEHAKHAWEMFYSRKSYSLQSLFSGSVSIQSRRWASEINSDTES
jgi:hypothetical protein